MNDKIKEMVEEIQEWAELPFVQYEGELATWREITFVPLKTKREIQATHQRFNRMLRKDYSEEEIGQFKESYALLKDGAVVCLALGEDSLFHEDYYSLGRMSKSSDPHGIMPSNRVIVYDVQEANEAGEKIQSMKEVDERFVEKLDQVNKSVVLALMGEKRREGYSIYMRHGGQRVFVSDALQDKVEELYEKMQEHAKSPEGISVALREKAWNSASPNKRWQMAKDLGSHLYSKFEDDEELWEVINGAVGGYLKTDQQTGGKKLVRKPQYIQKKPGKWAELTFKRFMGDGTRPIEWRKLASGLQAKFAVKGEVRGYVDKDLKERRIDAGQHREYMRRIEQFEDNLNLAIQERYGFSQPL